MEIQSCVNNSVVWSHSGTVPQRKYFHIKHTESVESSCNIFQSLCNIYSFIKKLFYAHKTY